MTSEAKSPEEVELQERTREPPSSSGSKDSSSSRKTMDLKLVGLGVSISFCLILSIMGTILIAMYANLQTDLRRLQAQNIEFLESFRSSEEGSIAVSIFKDKLELSDQELSRWKKDLSNLKGTVAKAETALKSSMVIGSDCQDLLQHYYYDGVYTIQNEGTTFKTFCDMMGGGWLVFQRRFDGTTDFRQDNITYVKGFGNPDKEYWLGLEKLHQLTKTGTWQMKVQLLAYDGDEGYALYDTFSVGEGPGYILNIGGYSGTAGDSLTRHGNGMKFSSYNYDQDKFSGDCSGYRSGAWWYNNCGRSNLNSFKYGNREQAFKKSMSWYSFKSTGVPIKESTMMIRRK